MGDAPAHDRSPVGGEGASAPLTGRTIIVTRAREQARSLIEPLEALGAEVIACPVIAIVDPPDWALADEAIEHLQRYDWVVFTSTNAVERFLARMRARGRGTDALAAVHVAAVGAATARALERHGITPALVPPKEFRAEALADEFVARGAGPGWRVLIPRALEAREVFPEALRERGVAVDIAPVYMTVPATPPPEAVEPLREGRIDAVTFTSPSTVRNFIALLHAAGLDPHAVLERAAAASIGPVTSDALRTAGVPVAVEAEPSTVEGLVAGLRAHFADPGAGAS